MDLSLAGATATGTDATSNFSTVSVSAAAKPYVTINFTPATANGKYVISVRLDDESIVTVTVDGAGLTAAQLADAVRTELMANGFGAADVESSNGVVTIWKEGNDLVENVTVSLIGNSTLGPGNTFTLPTVKSAYGATVSRHDLYHVSTE